MLARFARGAKGCLVVVESSGGYERALTRVLAEHGVDYARVNPRQAREFARATGQLAKTAKADAKVLAHMGRALELAPTPPPDPDRVRLADLVARREDLVTDIGRESNRLGVTNDAWTSKEITRLIKALNAHLADLDARIAALVETCEALARDNRRLRSVKGIGPVVAAVLMARLPELAALDPHRPDPQRLDPHRLDHRQLASLAGLAPHAGASGVHRGKRKVWGGRAEVRRALYIAAKSASQWDPVVVAFKKRLTLAGKPFKVTILACARKMLTILAAMFRNGEDYRKTAA